MSAPTSFASAPFASTCKLFWRLLLGTATLSLLGLTACDLTRPDDTGYSLPAVTSRMNVGEATTCALSSANLLYCWGRNSGLFEYSKSPATLPPSAVPVNTTEFDLVALMGGHGSHACALNAAREGRCWGRNTHGQLGGNTPVTSGSTTVTVVVDGIWSSISASRLTTCGVTAHRDAYCWGTNQKGEGGNASRALGSTALQPVRIDGTEEYQSVAAGWLHGCGLTTLGVALCWGDNAQGQLGLGFADSVPHRTPTPVATAVRFQQLSAGANYTCGISLDLTAYCWGQNITGALGDGTTTMRTAPTAVSTDRKFTRVYTSTGFGSGSNASPPSLVPGATAHTCAITSSGAAFCWGWNGAGQLGDGTFIDKLTPVAVSGGLFFDEVGLGGTHTCGRRNNSIYCWGGNAEGQLGNGSTANSNVPVSAGTPFRGS